MLMGAIKGFSIVGSVILICGLSASLSAMEAQVGLALSALKSRVLKSVGSVGPTVLQLCASLSVTRSKVAPAGAGADEDCATADPADRMIDAPQIRIQFLIAT